MRGGNGRIEREVLHGLQIQLYARDRGGFLLQPLGNKGGGGGAAVMWLEVDQKAPLIERGVLSVHPDEGGEREHVRVAQQNLGQFLLVRFHVVERDVLRGHGNAL